MRWIPIAMLLAVLLAGCQTNGTATIVRTKLQAVHVPERLYNCPEIGPLPKLATLTDVQVARIIVRLKTVSDTCRQSIYAIKSYIERAEARINAASY